MAIKANLVIDQGTDYSTTVNLTDDDGNPTSLSGYSVAAKLRKWYTSSNSVSFSATVNEDLGQVTLQLTDSQTGNLVPGRYVYDVLLTNGGITSRIVEGIITVTPGVTR